MIWGYHHFRKHPYKSSFFCLVSMGKLKHPWGRGTFRVLGGRVDEDDEETEEASSGGGRDSIVVFFLIFCP